MKSRRSLAVVAVASRLAGAGLIFASYIPWLGFLILNVVGTILLFVVAPATAIAGLWLWIRR